MHTHINAPLLPFVDPNKGILTNINIQLSTKRPAISSVKLNKSVKTVSKDYVLLKDSPCPCSNWPRDQKYIKLASVSGERHHYIPYTHGQIFPGKGVRELRMELNKFQIWGMDLGASLSGLQMFVAQLPKNPLYKTTVEKPRGREEQICRVLSAVEPCDDVRTAEAAAAAVTTRCRQQRSHYPHPSSQVICQGWARQSTDVGTLW